ncbi:MAG: hypothetical protein L0219_20480 [Phycisphaerales bacterium]|nr:hypothetical protein [Phycisphaerales bacterium]
MSHNRIGRRQFEMMKKGSYFTAVSRGAFYDMNGLVRALDSERLSASNATVPEPLSHGRRLWKFGEFGKSFDDVIITPTLMGCPRRCAGACWMLSIR